MDMPKTVRKLVKSPSTETEKAQTREVGEGKKEGSMTGEKLRKVSRMGFLGFRFVQPKTQMELGNSGKSLACPPVGQHWRCLAVSLVIIV